MSIAEPCPLPASDRPRERLRRFGVDALSDTELLALVLGTGRPGEPVLALAARLLADYRGARGLLHAGAGMLSNDLGFARAARLEAAIELARRGLAETLGPHTVYGSSRDVTNAFGPRLVDRTEEQVHVVVLDAKKRPIAERVLARGGPNWCAVSVRDVFALVMREGGSAVLLVHNHPSGDPAPSTDDLALTRRLANAGRALDVPLLDHVIVAREGAFSFLDAGLLSMEDRTTPEGRT